MVSVLDSRLSGRGSSPGQRHCIVFLGRTLDSHSATLHPGVQMGTGKLKLGVTLQCTSIQSREVEIFLVASCYRNWEKLQPDVPLGSHADLTFPYLLCSL